MSQYNALTGLTNVSVSTIKVKQNAIFQANVQLSNLDPYGVLALDGNENITSNVLPNGSILIGSTGLAPVVSTITGTANQTNVVNGAGSIVIGAAQDISSTSSPTFNNLTLTGSFDPATIGGNIIPAANNTYDIGTSTFGWRNIYSVGTINAGGLNASGLIGTDSKKNLQSIALGSSNANGANSTLAYSGNTLTLNNSMTQNLDTTGSPTFQALTVNGAATLGEIVTNYQHNSLIATDVNQILNPVIISNSNGCNISITSAGSGPQTLACTMTQNVGTSGTPSFASVTAGTINGSGLTTTTILATDGSKNLQSTNITNNSANGNNSTLAFSGNTITLNASNSQDVSSTGSPTFGNITDNGLTASAIVSNNASKQLVSAVISNSSGCNFSVNASGNISASMTQDVSNAGAPTFANITDNGLTASSLVSNNASKQLVSAAITNSSGCNFSVNASGNITASMTQNLTTSGSPSLAGLALTGNMTMSANNISSVGSITGSGTISTTNTTDATSITSGSIQTSGGAGIAKTIYCGTGINFGGATLNNYTAPTSWTPSLYSNSTGTLTTGTVYSTQSGSYFRIGNMVMATFTIATSTKPTNASGTSLFINLPVAASAQTQAQIPIVSANNALASGDIPYVAVIPSSTFMNLDYFISGGSTSTFTVASWNNNSQANGHIVYFV